MFKAAVCRVRGHRALCEQEATLLPDGSGWLDHTHTCLRCGLVLIFQREDLPDELSTELQAYADPGHTLVLMMDPSYAHRTGYVQ